MSVPLSGQSSTSVVNSSWKQSVTQSIKKWASVHLSNKDMAKWPWLGIIVLVFSRFVRASFNVIIRVV